MLQFEHPIILFAAALILSLLLALFIYHKDSRFQSAKPVIKAILIGLRFISFSIIILLLFKPKWLNEIKKLEKPILVFLQDASSSILNHTDSNYYQNEFIALIDKNNKQLEAEFDIYTYSFSDSIKEGLDTNYTGKSTDISKAFKNISDRFHNRNLAGIILSSDGNYNQGINPYYQISELKAPVYTMALGDTAIQRDLSIESVRHNEIAYFQNEFPLEFEVLSNFNSKTEYRILISHKGKTVYEEFVKLATQTPVSKQIFIEAKDEGIQYYDISISSFDGEKNTKNNTHRIAIEVLNNLQNILILSSAPHPDIAALKTALEEGKNYQVTSSLFHQFKDEIEAFNLIILHQIPDYTKRNQDLLKRIIENETSVFFIGGKSTKWSKFNQIQNFVEVKSKNSMQEVFPRLNEHFSPFKLSKACKEFIQAAPPLQAPFGEVINKDIDHALFKQNIESIKTNKNLLFFAEQEEKQIAVLLAEGLWKWKLFDYQKNESHANFNEWIQSISQYLTLNKDKRKLRLQYPKIISQGNSFQINAQLYNDNYQLIDDADVRLYLYDKDKTEYIYTLNSNGNTYNTSIDNLNYGTHQFKVVSKFNDQQTQQRGTFAVLESQLEQHKLEADWTTLKKISDNTQGLFLQKKDFDNYAEIIINNIEAQSQVYFSKQLSDLIKQKSIFLLLLLSLILEWGIRKRLGTH